MKKVSIVMIRGSFEFKLEDDVVEQVMFDYANKAISKIENKLSDFPNAVHNINMVHVENIIVSDE